MGDKKDSKQLAVHAGTTGGRSIFTAAVCTALWYTIDDRLAGLVTTPSLGTLDVTLVFVVLAIVAMLLSLAGMRWGR